MLTMSRIQPVTTDCEIQTVTIADSPLQSSSFTDRGSVPSENLNLLEPPNTGIIRDIKSESIIPHPVFDHRFRDMVEKVESLPLDKAIKYDALTTIWLLIREIDSNQLNWFEPIVHIDYPKYMCIKWRRGTRSLYLNIDDEEQWWSKISEEDNKIKTDFDNLDYDNVLIHWEWLING